METAEDAPRELRWREWMPPRVALWNSDEQTYGLAPRNADFCVASWATTNREHMAGDLCGREPVSYIGDAGFCAHHEDRLERSFLRRKITRHKKLQAELEDTIRERSQRISEEERLADERRSIVYYLYRPGDHMVRIGTTSKWKDRFGQHKRDYGPDLVLLYRHVGGRDAEREMHRKWAELRSGRSEWFAVTPSMLNWMLRQRQHAPRGRSALPEMAPAAYLRRLAKALPPRDELSAVPLAPPKKPSGWSLATPVIPDEPYPASPNQVYCTAKSAAAYLGLTVAELKAWHSSGSGPRYIDPDNWVRYRCDVLRDWARDVVAKHLSAEPAA